MATINYEPLSSLKIIPASAEHSSPSTSSGQQVALTTVAAARKKKLEEDPWTADVQSRSVWCIGCETRIKLSTKSMYDSYHWEVHKRRCKKITGSRRAQLPTKKGTATAKSKGKEKEKKSSPVASTSSHSTYTSTPSLTSDDEDDDGEMSTADRDLSPPPPILVRHPNKRDLATEQYLARSHGIHIRLPPSPSEAQDDWRQWSWSQLRTPEFATTPTTTSLNTPASIPRSEPQNVISAARQDYGGLAEGRSGSVREELPTY